jgi:hypothetical protein
VWSALIARVVSSRDHMRGRVRPLIASVLGIAPRDECPPTGSAVMLPLSGCTAKHASHALGDRPEDLPHEAGDWTVDLPWPEPPEPDDPRRHPDWKGGDAQLDSDPLRSGPSDRVRR